MDLETGLQATGAIAAAAALGQLVTRRLPIPLPVFLLAAGLLLGRDGLEVVKTSELSDFIGIAVAIAVALIVFEGGTILSVQTLRVLAPSVRNLVLFGLVLTPIVGMLAARLLLDFPWRVAALFGALVVVTGPSVITPLLRSVRVNDRLRAILMGEGVIIDPFGALLTLVLLQVATAESFDPAGPTNWVISRMIIGVIVGAAGALFVWGLPHIVRRMSSREVSMLVIGAAVTAFAVAESIGNESGLTAMVVMGIALGSLQIPHREEFDEFQESIVAFLVAAVYVLLAASVSIDSVLDLWPRGLFVVLALVLVGRPLLVFVSTYRSNLTMRERTFLAAVAPRGVVAASLASFVAVDVGGGLGGNTEQFVALVFVVILLTIGVQSVYAGPLARALKVRPVTTVIAGAGQTGRRVAQRLKEAGRPVVLIDSDENAAVAAREAGFEVILGDMGKVADLRKAGVAEADSFLLTASSDDRALLAAQLARTTLGCQRVFARVNDPENVQAFRDLGVTVVSPQDAVALELAALAGASPLSDIMLPVDSDVHVERIVVTNDAAQRPIMALGALRGTVVIVVRRGSTSVIPTGRTNLQLGDVLTVIGNGVDMERVRKGLTLDRTTKSLGL
jgi:NhaP-type Na+/H+ or K+/H+ antiporter